MDMMLSSRSWMQVSRLKLSVHDCCIGTISTHVWKSMRLMISGDLDGLVVPDPNRSGRMPELLKAAGILRRELGNEVLIVGCVLGPMTLAMQLMGPEKALFLAADEPDLFGRVLDFATDVAISIWPGPDRSGSAYPVCIRPLSIPGGRASAVLSRISAVTA